MGDQRWADSLLHSVIWLSLLWLVSVRRTECKWVSCSPQNDLLFPPSSVSYRPDKSQQTQSMDRCVLHLTLNELIITGFSRCAVIMLCIPNVAITHCWLKLIEDYVFPRQCVHVLFENEMLLHIHRGTVFVWVLEFGSLYLTVAELKISRADTDPTDKIHRLILKEFKNTFPCLLKKFFY